ncbi:SagB/ThcOx family dehydrogenase [Natronorarus salvus]|uniref:SagB/ThcOx family dehydrogenase n=1 Tax=Natronorarus salvus TaxID=3117733 RepID=UPI002F269BBC
MVDAREYHERTNHSPESVREEGFELDFSNRPQPYKLYTDLPRVALSSVHVPIAPVLSAVSEAAADPLADAEQPSPRALDHETLATLCYEANGVVKTVTADGRELAFRAASCTGKLYHVDLYLVCGDCGGLDAGVYHFDPRTFSFDVLREGDYRGVVAEAAGDYPPVVDAPATVVATSTWWRNAWKYRERTYRHAFWDSGTVLANLLAAAHALDRRAEVVTAFADDALSGLLGVDPEHEAPLAAVTIGHGEPAPKAIEVTPIDPATEPLSERVVEYPLIPDAWRQSTLDGGNTVEEWRERCLEAGSIGTSVRTDDEDGDRVALDPVGHGTASARPLHHTIVRRGSCREFSGEAVGRRKLGTVLDRATRGVPADWNRCEADGLRYNDVYALVAGVEGVPDGTYRFHPTEGELERLGEVDRRTKTHLALDQTWAGAAHVNVYLMADVERIVERLGNRGYRLAQLEAGITLGRLYLATYAHRDLGGTGLTFYDCEVSDHLSPRDAGHVPTCLFAFGRREGA